MRPSRLLRSIWRVHPLHSGAASSFLGTRLSLATWTNLQLGTLRPNSSTAGPRLPLQSNPVKPATTSPSSEEVDVNPPEPRLLIAFTCTAQDCNHRSAHSFTKRAYTRGIVLVQCPSCKNRHLIADNLGWFKDTMEEGKLKTVEDILRARGESVRRVKLDSLDGDIEFVDN